MRVGGSFLEEAFALFIWFLDFLGNLSVGKTFNSSRTLELPKRSKVRRCTLEAAPRTRSVCQIQATFIATTQPKIAATPMATPLMCTTKVTSHLMTDIELYFSLDL